LKKYDKWCSSICTLYINICCLFICISRKKERNRKPWKWRGSFSTCRFYQVLSRCCFVSIRLSVSDQTKWNSSGSNKIQVSQKATNSFYKNKTKEFIFAN